MLVNFKKLDEEAFLPEYKTEGSAGLDLRVLLKNELKNEKEEVLKAGEIKLFKTGLAMALPKGYEAQIRSRSGLSLKNGIIILNAPGTVDSDYRGEIGLIVMNCGKEDFVVENGMRLAQMVISKYEKIEINLVENIDITERNADGFGSTGV